MGAAASTIVDLIPPAESLTTTLTGDALAAPADRRKEREQMEMHCMFALSTLLADCGVIGDVSIDRGAVAGSDAR